MQRVCRSTILFAAGICIAMPALGRAQALPPATARRDGVGLALTYAAQRSNTSGTGAGFWLQGIAAEADIPATRGLNTRLSLVADLAYGHNGGIGSGVALDSLSVTAGPRLLQRVPYRGKIHLTAFAEVLGGVEHGYNSVFLANGGVAGSATSFALITGGGLDLSASHRLGLRVVQVDYVRSQLPNGYANAQNDLRIASGLTLRFGKH
jgi:hypothetical protein